MAYGVSCPIFFLLTPEFRKNTHISRTTV